MKPVLAFVKATVIGGLLFLVPVIVVGFVVGKALQWSMKLAQPMAGFLPIDSVVGIAFADVLGLVTIMAVCFVAGLVARNSLASNTVREAEARFLWKIPAYSFVKGLADSFGGEDGAATLRPVLARFDDAAQLAFEVERLRDGRVVIYVPGAPDPWSGAVLVMTEDRIEPLPVSMVAAVQNLRALGRGAGAVLS
jgi:uncharacterized membrane protein